MDLSLMYLNIIKLLFQFHFVIFINFVLNFFILKFKFQLMVKNSALLSIIMSIFRSITLEIPFKFIHFQFFLI